MGNELSTYTDTRRSRVRHTHIFRIIIFKIFGYPSLYNIQCFRVKYNSVLGIGGHWYNLYLGVVVSGQWSAVVTRPQTASP